jgi:pimeloyl-ACP methyl ester carboxylesterase
MQDVYFISGLGADHRLFQYLELQDIRPHFVHWITPAKNESWESYAGRLLSQITTPMPILVGMSMGGMMAMEISRLIAVRKIILVSSAKNYREIPPYFRLLRVFKGHEWVSYRLLTRLGLLLGGWLFGTSCKADERLLREIIHDTDETFFRWAWQRVATWRSTYDNGRVVHIHGDRDHMLPIRYSRPDVVIPGGTHLMIVNKAEEISAVLQPYLRDALTEAVEDNIQKL